MRNARHRSDDEGATAAPMPASVTGHSPHLEVERRLPLTTRLAYARDLERLVAIAGQKDASVESLSRQDLAELVRASMIEGRSAASTARMVSGVRGFYRYLSISGRIAANPASDLKPPRDTK